MRPMPLEPVGRAQQGWAAERQNANPADGVKSFADLLKNQLGEVNQLQKQADGALRDIAVGNTENLHDLMYAINEADLSFRLMMQVRNKLVDAYNEIMRMQV